MGVDGPPASESAIAIAFDEASRRGVDIVAGARFRSRRHVDGGSTACTNLAGWQERYPDVAVHRVITRDHPADVLLDQSRRAQLVSSAAGRAAASRAKLLGSVSAPSFRPAAIPVIVATGTAPLRPAHPYVVRSTNPPARQVNLFSQPMPD